MECRERLDTGFKQGQTSECGQLTPTFRPFKLPPMGNTASNPNRTTNIQRTDLSSSTAPSGNRDASSSPSPGNPHRSLRTKKKSLELPDLASLSLSPSSSNTRGRQKAAAIPIPAAPNTKGPFSHYHEAQGIQPQRQRPRNFPSTTSVLQDDFDEVLALEGHRIVPYTPPSLVVQQQSHRDQHQQQQRPHPPPPRGRQAHLSNIQELYDRSLDPHHPAAPPSSPASLPRPVFAREVVRSSIPTVLGEAAIQAATTQDCSVLSPIQEDLAADPVPVNIVWKGGGSEVVLSRAGDDDWKGRQPMEREYVFDTTLFFFSFTFPKCACLIQRDLHWTELGSRNSASRVTLPLL